MACCARRRKEARDVLELAERARRDHLVRLARARLPVGGVVEQKGLLRPRARQVEQRARLGNVGRHRLLHEHVQTGVERRHANIMVGRVRRRALRACACAQPRLEDAWPAGGAGSSPAT